MERVLLLLILPLFLLNLVKDKHFVVLLQNNYEIRPSGGFMGSYADIYFEKHKIKSWKIEDIYVPDGQLQGHVDPPAPIQEAFKTGDYRLRNANWKINFPDAATEITWFFEKGGLKDIDGIVAINLTLVEKILEIVGPLKPLDFSEEVDSKNFYKIAQGYSENDFFPGSIKKGSYLSGVGRALLEKVLDSGPSAKVQIAKLILSELNGREIYIWAKDEGAQAKIEKFGWSGSLGTYKVDYFYPVESNLGANKVNYYVARDIVRKVETDKDKFTVTTTITWKNSHTDSWEYINYERIVLPKNTLVKSLIIDGRETVYDTEIQEEFKIIGVWVKVLPNSDSKLGLIYTLPRTGNQKYEVVIRKQPGL